MIDHKNSDEDTLDPNLKNSESFFSINTNVSLKAYSLIFLSIFISFYFSNNIKKR